MSIRFRTLIIVLLLITGFCILLNLQTGYIPLKWMDFYSTASENHLIAELRINRVLAMILAGLAIPTSGFLLQEYFQNPLAGPSVLGITSAASLSVAIYIFLSHNWLLSEWSNNSLLATFAVGGSFLMMLLLLSFSKKFYDKTFLIIFGFLISALAGALVSILQLYADNQSLKNYILWSFGANNQVGKPQLMVLFFFVISGLFLSFKAIKPLIGNSLGTAYAKTLGVNLNRLKYLIIIGTSLLSASITAFLGPILFIGIVVPHFSRLIYNPAKLWQQWLLNMVLGMVTMLVFSVISESFSLPINVISSLFGIPVILMMMLKSKNRY